jgi:hypothetical protein
MTFDGSLANPVTPLSFTVPSDQAFVGLAGCADANVASSGPSLMALCGLSSEAKDENVLVVENPFWIFTVKFC